MKMHAHCRSLFNWVRFSSVIVR